MIFRDAAGRGGKIAGKGGDKSRVLPLRIEGPVVGLETSKMMGRSHKSRLRPQR